MAANTSIFLPASACAAWATATRQCCRARGSAKKLLHVSNYFYIEQRGQVAALLSKLANDDTDGARVLADAIAAGDETTAAALGAPAAGERVWETFFGNSGAEANEAR